VRTSRGWMIVGLSMLAGVASAQTATFRVDSAGAISPADPTLVTTQKLSAKTPAVLAVQCTDNGCKQVSATLNGTTLTPSAPSDAAVSFRIDKENAKVGTPVRVVVSRSASQTFGFEFTSSGDLSDGAAGTGSRQSTLDAEYSKCTSVPTQNRLDEATTTAIATGERQGNKQLDGLGSLFNGFKPRVATFIVLPNGSVLQRPVNVDEGQTVVVAVYASKTVMGDLVVKRTSAIRTPDVFRVIGGDVDISKLQLQALTADRAETCDFHYQVLGDDFAPGAGAFEIRSFTAQKAIGSVEFGVDALYSGIYSLGAMRSDAIDPDFYLSSDGTTQTIRQRNLGDRDVLYAITYTPFVWGKRSLQESPPLLHWQRLNPTVGVVLDDVSDNFVAGISYDLGIGGLVLTYGKHWRRVSRLDPAANLAPGSTFPGTMEQLPQGKEWVDDTFVALTIDLRAAVGLFQKAVRGGSN
jgi:hypothetical protein